MVASGTSGAHPIAAGAYSEAIEFMLPLRLACWYSPTRSPGSWNRALRWQPVVTR
jgi:hypothetical protein